MRYLIIGALFAASVTMYRRERLRNEALLQTEIAQAQLGQQLDEARLQALLAQIEPHFLFNTLANVRAPLPDRSPPAAETDARQPAALPDASRCRACASPTRRSAARPTLAEAYLGVQQIRMGKRLAFSIDVPASAAATRRCRR